MYNSFQLASKYFSYILESKNGKGHGIHSPFVFDFVKNILNDKRHYYSFDHIERLREELRRDNRKVSMDDQGAGSISTKEDTRTISSIVSHAAKSPTIGRLLFRMISYYKPVTVLELGTSLGISAAYMASANLSLRLITIEANRELSEIAQQNMHYLSLKNVCVRNGGFDELLQPVLNDVNKVDCAFIDGNHRLEPTLRYFHQIIPFTDNNSFLIFDDIHWSREMEDAWAEIKIHPSVTCSIDLFFIGIVFFRKEFQIPRHFIIRYKYFGVI